MKPPPPGGEDTGGYTFLIPFCLLCSQLDGNGDGEPGVLMMAQTITSESLCTTTTTHITKVPTRKQVTSCRFLPCSPRHCAGSLSADAERRPVGDEDREAHRHHRGLRHRPRRGQFAVLILTRLASGSCLNGPC